MNKKIEPTKMTYKNKYERFVAYKEIIKRATALNVNYDDELSMLMDIESADVTFKLRLGEWLIASDFNFLHDFIGIKNNIKRDKFPCHDFGWFIPRFAGK